MSDATQKAFWIFLAIVITLGVVWQTYPLPDAKKRMDALPLNGPGFRGEEIAATPFEVDFFKGVNMIKRMYKVDDRSFFVTVLDGTHNRHVVHDPYYCITGSGWQINHKESLTIPGGEASLVSMNKDGYERQALFWFSNGTTRFASPMHYWIEATIRRVSLGWSGPEPVLILIQPLDNKSVDWHKLIDALNPVFSI